MLYRVLPPPFPFPPSFLLPSPLSPSPPSPHLPPPAGEGSAFLSFRKGDLILLESEDGDDVMRTGWSYGKCERTQAKGDFPAECVYVLPTLTRSPNEVLVSLVVAIVVAVIVVVVVVVVVD